MFSTRLQRAYPSDLTDAQWDLLVPLIPPLSPDAAYHVHERREMVNCHFVRVAQRLSMEIVAP
jgi:transposase